MSDYPEHKELLEGFRQGNEQAVRRLFHLFYASLHYYAHSMIDHTQEAQDIAVESILKLLERKTQFSSIAAIRSFLFTTTRNAGIDFLRKLKRHDNAHQQLGLMQYATCPAGKPRPQYELFQKKSQLIYHAFST